MITIAGEIIFCMYFMLEKMHVFYVREKALFVYQHILVRKQNFQYQLIRRK